jgi:hypothetical protein
MAEDVREHLTPLDLFRGRDTAAGKELMERHITRPRPHRNKPGRTQTYGAGFRHRHFDRSRCRIHGISIPEAHRGR